MMHAAASVASMASPNFIPTSSSNASFTSCTLASPKLHPHVMPIMGRRVKTSAVARASMYIVNASISVAKARSPHAYAHMRLAASVSPQGLVRWLSQKN